MFLKKLRSLRHTLALRLTVWYAGIFVASCVLAFMLVYVLMVSIVQERTDADLEEDIDEFAVLMRSGGLERVKAEMLLEAQGEEASDVFLRLWTPAGDQIATTDLSSWPELGTPDGRLLRLDSTDKPVLETLALPDREHKVRSVYGSIGPGLVLQIGESLEEDEALIRALLTGFLITIMAIIALGGPIGWFMARRALRGVEEVTRTAAEIADGALDRRVPARSGDDELDKLAQTFNTMLDRIQALILGMRQMTDNLAHDLRSPVARIRAFAEMTLAGGGSRAEWESLAANTTEECDRLLEMINTTLDIAEAESGAAKLRVTDVDLVDVISLIFELNRPDDVVLTAMDGESGIQLVRGENPDVIILDIGLPGIDGFEVCREIRRFSRVPIIFLTVRHNPEAVELARQVGGDDYVTKPFDSQELLKRVSALLEPRIGQ